MAIDTDPGSPTAHKAEQALDKIDKALDDLAESPSDCHGAADKILDAVDDYSAAIAKAESAVKYAQRQPGKRFLCYVSLWRNGMPNITTQISTEIAVKEREIGRLRSEVSALKRALSALSGKVATRRGQSAGRRKSKKAGRRAKRGENPRRVLAAMSSKSMAVKDISARSGVSSPTINAVLAALTKRGRVERKGRGSYRLKGRSAKRKPIVRVPAG